MVGEQAKNFKQNKTSSMGLTEQLNDLKKQLRHEMRLETLKEIAKFVKELAKSGIEENSCQAGDRMPGFILPNACGRMISSDDILARGPMVLSFYRRIC